MLCCGLAKDGDLILSPNWGGGPQDSCRALKSLHWFLPGPSTSPCSLEQVRKPVQGFEGMT